MFGNDKHISKLDKTQYDETSDSSLYKSNQHVASSREEQHINRTGFINSVCNVERV